MKSLLLGQHCTYIYVRLRWYVVGRIGWKSGKGRCVLATRDITALELILFDAAIGKKERILQ
jgi:hypothetical protein